MNTNNFTSTILVNKTPVEAFDAIKDFRAWWSEDIEGASDKTGETFFYHYWRRPPTKLWFMRNNSTRATHETRARLLVRREELADFQCVPVLRLQQRAGHFRLPIAALGGLELGGELVVGGALIGFRLAGGFLLSVPLEFVFQRPERDRVLDAGNLQGQDAVGGVCAQ